MGYLLYSTVYDSVLCCGGQDAPPDPRRQYEAHFIAGGITGVVRQYCSAEPPVSGETLYDIMLGLFSGRFDMG